MFQVTKPTGSPHTAKTTAYTEVDNSGILVTGLGNPFFLWEGSLEFCLRYAAVDMRRHFSNYSYTDNHFLALSVQNVLAITSSK